MHLRILVVLAALALASAAFAQQGPGFDSGFQVAYLANYSATAVSDDVINITNAGSVAGTDPAGTLCANVYTFDPAEELIACCTCAVTPNALRSLSARQDLVSNTLTPGTPTSITVVLTATTPISAGKCSIADATTAPTGAYQPGLRAWATSTHAGSVAGAFVTTENAFSFALPAATEITKLTQYCNFINLNGSSYGICKSCRANGLGATSK